VESSRRHLRSVPRERSRFSRSYLGAIEENISAIERFLSFSRYRIPPPRRIEWIRSIPVLAMDGGFRNFSPLCGFKI
jgi:hypothetical protein